EDPEAEAEGMPAVPIPVAVRGHHDSRAGGAIGDGGGHRLVDARVVRGVDEKPAADRQDGDEQDGGEDAAHMNRAPLNLAGSTIGSDLPRILASPCGAGV